MLKTDADQNKTMGPQGSGVPVAANPVLVKAILEISSRQDIILRAISEWSDDRTVVCPVCEQPGAQYSVHPRFIYNDIVLKCSKCGLFCINGSTHVMTRMEG
jgi:hypothetical protein